MPRSAVDIVRAFQPRKGVDIARMFRDDEEMTAMLEAIAPLISDDFVCAFNGVDWGERRGGAGLREVWLDWLGPWDSYLTGDKDFVDLGDRVLVLVTDTGRRAGTSEDVVLHGAALYSVRDGKITRAEYYAQRADAYRAAGLEPPA